MECFEAVMGSFSNLIKGLIGFKYANHVFSTFVGYW